MMGRPLMIRVVFLASCLASLWPGSPGVAVAQRGAGPRPAAGPATAKPGSPRAAGHSIRAGLTSPAALRAALQDGRAIDDSRSLSPRWLKGTDPSGVLVVNSAKRTAGVGTVRQSTLGQRPSAPGSAGQPEAGTAFDGPPLPVGVSGLGQAGPTTSSWLAFDGSRGGGWTPASPSLAVGPKHVVAAVNSRFNLYDKATMQALNSAPIDLVTWFDARLKSLGANRTFQVAGPRVLYDQLSDRYVLAAIASDIQANMSIVVFAVSPPGNPGASWCAYHFAPAQEGETLRPYLAQNITMATNRDALLVTADLTVQSERGAVYVDTRAFTFAKSIFFQSACADDSAQIWRWQVLEDDAGDSVWEARAIPNLDGTDALYVAATDSDDSDRLSLWTAQTQRNTDVAILQDFSYSDILVDDYTVPPDAVQKDTGEPIATGVPNLTSGLLQRGRLWLAHTVGCDGDAAACMQWYAINPTNQTVLEDNRVYWSGTESYFPSIAVDRAGLPVMVHNRSGASEYVSVGFGDGRTDFYVFRAGRPGFGSACYDDQRGTDTSVWGFEAPIAVDPDDGSIWAHAAYAGGSSSQCGQNPWLTAIVHIDWSDRSPAPGPSPTVRPGPTATPSPGGANWSIGIPNATNREFRGYYDGVSRFNERRGSVSGRANSAIQVQNLDGTDVLVPRVEFLAQRDPYLADRALAPASYPIALRSIAAGAAANMYLPSLNIPPGHFSAVIESTNDLISAAIARTDWSTGGAAIYSNVDFDGRIIVPLVVRNYYGLSSILSLMAANDNDESVPVSIDIFRVGSSSAIAGPRLTLHPSEGVMLDLNDAIGEFSPLGSGFLGSAVITAGRSRVGVASFVYSEASDKAVSGFEGVSADSASDTLYAPLFRSRHRVGGALLDTGISVVNTQSTPADVTVTYFPTRDRSASEACRSRSLFSHGPIRIAGNSSYVFYQGLGGGHGLPDNCFGSAIIRGGRAADRLLAIVNDATNVSELTAAYNAVPAALAFTKIAVPLFRNKHLAQLYTTGIQAMNTGTRPAKVEISFTRAEGNDTVPITGCSDDCLVFINPNESYTWYPPNIAAIPANVYGSAILKSDQPIAVIVNDYPLAGGVDAAIYNGIPIDDRAEGVGRRSVNQGVVRR